MQDIHFVVACHGMWGEPVHLDEMARTLREKFPEDSVDKNGVKLHLLVAKTNALDSTYDGVDWGGERIAEEVLKSIEDLEKDGHQKVTRFSAIGYSLGGLLVRYVIGILNEKKFFDNVKPVNFTTFAAPNVGLLRTEFIFSKIGFALGPKVMSRTGPQFYGRDSWGPSGEPLIEVLADPKRPFYQGLAKFERLSLYGSAYGDKTVSYSTSLIEPNDPFYDHAKSGLTFIMHEKYPPIMLSYSVPSRPPTPEPKSAFGAPDYLRAPFSGGAHLPPPFQLRFPYNVLVMTLFPLLVPVALTAVFAKLSLDSSRSRRRLKLLEKDEKFQDRLINALGKMDKGMENAIAELIEEAGEVEENATGIAANEAQMEVRPNPKDRSRTGSPSSSSSTVDKITGESRLPKDAVRSPGAPVFSDLQLRIIDTLNELPFNKYAACFPGVFSSHAVIISRDMKRFPWHTQGGGVLRHWADHFIL